MPPMRDILPELLEVFRAEGRERLDALAVAIEKKDPVQLGSAAHGIKGAAANLGGKRLAEVCARLEKMGRGGTVEGAGEFVPEVEAQFNLLCGALERESRMPE